ncbi:hypothetical protein FACS189428_2320 [Clostridia bacterium]|nr:hypothetical protein FACS189428_2320 [Clostridia bacterium]
METKGSKWDISLDKLLEARPTRELTVGEKKKLKSYNLPGSAKERIEKAWKSRKNPEEDISWWGFGLGYLFKVLFFLFPVIVLWKAFGTESFSTLGGWGTVFYTASAIIFWCILGLALIIELTELKKKDAFSPLLLRFIAKKSFLVKAFEFAWELLVPIAFFTTGHYGMLVLYVIWFMVVTLVQKHEKDLIKDFFPADEDFVSNEEALEY